MAEVNELLDRAERIKMVLLARATGELAEDTEYNTLRRDLLEVARVRSKLPRSVVQCRTLGEFWNYIKTPYPHYKERREHIWSEFAPLLEMLELEAITPGDDAVTAALAIVDSDHVRCAWEKALERRSLDPDGAITSARTLLECVCKFVLDKSKVTYDDKADLPTLYARTAETLNIAPSQQTEQIMRQVLGGCQNVVVGLGALRNRLSDAHGKGIAGVSPEPRHAELAVNLAGAVALFLVSTWEAQI